MIYNQITDLLTSVSLLPKIITMGFNLFLINRITRLSRKFQYLHSIELDSKVSGMTSDVTHQITKNLYIAIITNKQYLSIVITLMMIIVNFSFLTLMYACFTNTRALYVSMYTYIAKATCNLLYQNTPPDGRFNKYLFPNHHLHWSKNSQTETFFSGHSSLMFLALLFCGKTAYPLVLVATVIMLPLIIILRIHYVIDIIGAFLFVYFFNSTIPYSLD